MAKKDEIGKEVHNTLHYKRKANKSRVKDRSRYGFVKRYEKEFKYKFGEYLQEAATEFFDETMEKLNVKDVKIGDE